MPPASNAPSSSTRWRNCHHRSRGVESFRSGVDLGLNPGNSDVAIVAEFADETAWRAYLEAPAHVAFIAEHVTPLCATWSAIRFDPSATS